MELITPFDLVEMFPAGRSLCLVGNAPSLRDAKAGGWIESFDVVVRFNEAALAGFEEDVGRRTDIFVTNPYPEMRRRPMLDEAGCRLVLVVNPPTRRGDKATFAEWIGDRKVLFTYTPDPGRFPLPGGKGGLTTGVAALALLRRILQPSTIGVTGFTMFQGHTAHSYWSDETPPGVAKHDMTWNAQMLIELLNLSPRTAIVTSEIAWLARRVDRPLSPQVRIRALPDPIWNAPGEADRSRPEGGSPRA